MKGRRTCVREYVSEGMSEFEKKRKIDKHGLESSESTRNSREASVR